MDFTKLAMILAGIAVAYYFMSLFSGALFSLFPLILQLQDLFLGLFKLMGYHSSSMIAFGSVLGLYFSLKIYFFVKSIISN